ncbi:MAG: hypothetical protein JRN15_08850 [Nitrososphaerota archaeon]|nr:hypothetical protein [Nitrososphaerota archaeon]
MMKFTLISAVGLILLGLIEVVLTMPVHVCTGPVCGTPSYASFYFNIGVILIICGMVSLFLSKFEHEPPMPKISA